MTETPIVIRVSGPEVEEIVARLLEAWQPDIYELRERGVRVLGADQCCLLACSGGACESCPCCVAGWCVWGTDGIPDKHDENYQNWLEEAKDHNPVAKKLWDYEAPTRETVRLIQELTVPCPSCGCTGGAHLDTCNA